MQKTRVETGCVNEPLSQACQTGGPRAACGPIACLMRPAVTSLSHTIT